jgi:hypothetical protein
LDYSTLLSGTSGSAIRGMTSDNAGNLYVTGFTTGPGFPTTSGAYRTAFAGGFGSAFVAKLNPQGQIVWSTLFGAPGAGDTYAYAVALDSQNDVYISGRAAPGLPTTPGVFQPYYDGVVDPAHGRDNGFLAKFSPDGAHLLWASYLGTGDDVRDIKVDAGGNVYALTDYNPNPGGSPAPPPAAWFVNGFQRGPQGGGDALVVEISSDGSKVLAGTYISGSGDDLAGTGGLALDATGVYVGFTTNSRDLPTPNGYQPTYGGGSYNFYVGKLSLDLSSVIYGTYSGGTGIDLAQTHEITLDAQGDVYLALYTSSPNLPTTPGAYQARFAGGNDDIYVAKISADGSTLLGATYLGGSGAEIWPDGPSVDARGNVYVGFSTTSTDIPTTPDALQRTNAGNADGYLAKLSADFTTLLYGTYLGGSEGTEANRDTLVDNNGNVYWAGDTHSGDFPTTNALQSVLEQGDDAFLVKFSPTTAPSVGLRVSPTSYTEPATITFRAQASDSDGTISQVDFYANHVLVGTSTMAPYTFTWNNVSAGGYLLTAVATTDQGATRTSNGVEVTVTGAENQAPVIVSPASSDIDLVMPYTYGDLFGGTSDPATETQLRVAANDDGGEANLTYTWTVLSKPDGAANPTFSAANGTNAGKNTTVTFHAAGAYSFLVTVNDQAGLSATSSVSVTAGQFLTSITVTGSSSSVNSNGTVQFTAVAKDQFGQPLVDQPPRFFFSSTGGSITNEGLFTAPVMGGSYQINAFSAASAPQLQGSTHIMVVTAGNQPPTVAMSARATVTSNPAVFNLSVLGSDSTGEADLIYTWGTNGSPSYSAPVTFGAANGTNAGKNTTATFSAQGGWGAAIDLVVTIANPITGLSVTGSVVVTVSPTFSIVVAPASATVANGATEQFSAVAVDQFGNVSLPTFSWSIDAGGLGTVDNNGLYTAPDSGTGSATVRATFVSVANQVHLSGTAGVTVTDQVPFQFTVTTSAGDPQAAGTPFDVTVTVQDAYGNTDAGYRGTIHFTSADPYGASLPADYTFTAGDAGTHTFFAGATLYTAGTWDVTATDPVSGITGSAAVNVLAAPAVTVVPTFPWYRHPPE